jgi:hypothetical protein
MVRSFRHIQRSRGRAVRRDEPACSNLQRLSKAVTATGYMHQGYAESMAEYGTPRELPRCGGWILQRRIPGFAYHDGMGCYPLFACRDWAKLLADLEHLESQLVSLALVADPFGEYDIACLQRCFDKLYPFKVHFVIDLGYPVNDIVSAHHRYYARKALRSVVVERCHEPIRFTDDWVALYATLIERHNIRGIRAFSRESFAKQLSVPGIVVFRAVHQGVTIGAHLWYIQGQVAYSHLEAVNLTGYKLRAAYALYWSAIKWFSNKVRWLDLGGGVGISTRGMDGLSKFKRGWSNDTRPAYFCGRVFDPEKYEQLGRAVNISETDYFPAYREGEFV